MSTLIVPDGWRIRFGMLRNVKEPPLAWSVPSFEKRLKPSIPRVCPLPQKGALIDKIGLAAEPANVRTLPWMAITPPA